MVRSRSASLTVATGIRLGRAKLASGLLRKPGVPAYALLPAHRITTLHNLSHRWIAEYPAILTADPERARHHAEAIADLELLIAELLRKAPAIPAVFESV